jgi:hypothetical protein
MNSDLDHVFDELFYPLNIICYYSFSLVVVDDK